MAHEGGAYAMDDELQSPYFRQRKEKNSVTIMGSELRSSPSGNRTLQDY